VKYGLGHLFFGHKLRVTRRHQSRAQGSRQGGAVIRVGSNRPAAITSIVIKDCGRCGGSYQEGGFSGHVKTPEHRSGLSRRTGSFAGALPSTDPGLLANLLSENERAVQWIQETGLQQLAVDLDRLIGGAGFDMAYRGETRELSFSPPLEELRQLGLVTRNWADQISANPAPTQGLLAVRATAIQMLVAIADFHMWKVNMLARFTPENIEDGSYQQLSAEISASLQPKIDAMTPLVAQYNGALAAVSASLGDLLGVIGAPSPGISKGV
jgi:hypothetical protein